MLKKRDIWVELHRPRIKLRCIGSSLRSRLKLSMRAWTSFCSRVALKVLRIREVLARSKVFSARTPWRCRLKRSKSTSTCSLNQPHAQLKDRPNKLMRSHSHCTISRALPSETTWNALPRMLSDIYPSQARSEPLRKLTQASKWTQLTRLLGRVMTHEHLSKKHRRWNELSVRRVKYLSSNSKETPWHPTRNRWVMSRYCKS